jgi:hypothetical protein
VDVSQPSDVLTARAAAAGTGALAGLTPAVRVSADADSGIANCMSRHVDLHREATLRSRVRGERGVPFCGGRGHTTAAAFDRALRAARLSRAEALRTA